MVAGVTFVADLSGALFWEEQSLLVVSDLHLEKGSSFATRGVLLPPYDTVATLGRLAAVIARHDPHMVIALGDSFHDRTAHERLSAPDRDALVGDAGAARLDLDFGQSRSGAAVRSRRRGRRAKSRSARSRSAMSRRGRQAKSPAICIPRRASRPAADRWSGDVLPATASAR